MLIQILGSGCAKCQKLGEWTRQAADETGSWIVKVIKVKDLQQIMSFGVMITPALVVDGVVKVAGRVPGVEDIKKTVAK